MVFPDNGADVHRAGGITRPRYMLHHMRERCEAVEKLLERAYGAETIYGNGLRLEPLESESHVARGSAYLGSARSPQVNFSLLLPRRFQLSVWPRDYDKSEGSLSRTPTFYPSMKSG